jgi:hypothetical protein
MSIPLSGGSPAPLALAVEEPRHRGETRRAAVQSLRPHAERRRMFARGHVIPGEGMLLVHRERAGGGR